MKTCISGLLYFLLAINLSAQNEKVDILWDTYGVPHIYGTTIQAMYYGFGWSQMHNHGNLIAKLYGQARGKAAEYWGSNYLIRDKEIHLFNIPALAKAEYGEQNPEFRTYLDAFTRGINDYVSAHPEAISQENKQVFPIGPEDVLAHCIRVIFTEFVAGEDIGHVAMMRPGSNAIAIAPSRSSAGAAMLLANPHLAWAGLFTFFEAHLQAAGFEAYGASLVGFPVLSIAFNEHLGWTHTVNPIDACDRYELSLKGVGYLLDSAVLPFEKRSIVLKVRQPDGTLTDQAITLNYSKQGPVFEGSGNKAFAIRIAGMANPDILYQWHRMALARNWKEFETALKMMQLPMFNVIYADQAGNILYFFDGNLPERPEFDWKFWHGAIDGTLSKYIWNRNLAYEDLPKLLNPRTGFVQNANDPPWNCTYPAELDFQKFPAYLSPQEMELRPQRAIDMIKHDSSVSFDDLIGFKLNTGMEAADRFLDDLILAVKQYPDSSAVKASLVLQQWDRRTDSNSRGAVLFSTWFAKIKNDMFMNSWLASDPIGTPSGLKDPKGAVDLLVQASREVLANYDSLNVAWGDIYRFRMNGADYPANGGAGYLGIYRTFYFRRDPDKKFRAVAGDSYVAVTEFGKKVRSKVLLSYGNASQAGSRHMTDQLPLLSRKQLRTAWLTKEDILKNLEEKESLTVRSDH
jgi:acyl-homoserine-lactone acylase